MPLSFCASSHCGVRRETNEDAYCAQADLGLFVVADGVGGYAGGEVASRAAVDAIRLSVARTRGWTEDAAWPFEYQPALGPGGNRLNWAFHQANERIRAEAQAARGRRGMATTIAAVLLEGDAAGPRDPARGATIGHVGDTRIYRWRHGRLDRLTRDHSWIGEQVAAGLMTEQQARSHPHRNLLTRALTGGAGSDPEFGWVPVTDGDRLLLCSDGLFGVLTDAQIGGILDQDTLVGHPAGESGGICDALVHAANLAGGPDNITAVLVRV